MPIKWYEKSYLGFMSLEKLNVYPISMLSPMDGYFTSKNLEPNIVLECKDVFTLLNFVAEEVVITILPQSEVRTVFEHRVKSVSIEDANEEIDEVAKVLNQLEGRKKIDLDASLEKELVDVIHYAISIASVNNIDLTKVITKKDKKAAIKYNQSPNLEEFLIFKR